METIEIFALTDTGSKALTNEDHILAGRFIKNRGNLYLRLIEGDDFIQDFGLLLAVSDGIGETAGGDAASQQVLSSFEHRFYASPKARYVQQALLDAMEQANQSILDIHARSPDWSQMGATLCGICLIDNGFYIFNIGNSRVFRYHNQSLRQLTRDDTLTAALTESGHKSQIDNLLHEGFYLTSFMGHPTFNPQIEQGPTFHTNDILLICTDGLYKKLSDQLTADTFNDPHKPLQDIAQNIIQQMISNGGNDNYSLILVRKIQDRQDS